MASKYQYRDFKKAPKGLASGWEDRIANYFRTEKINFTYEETTFTYDELVYSGRCRKCDNDRVVQVRKYTPDFFIKNADGTAFLVDGKPLIIEAKGYFDSSGRKQHRYLRDQYGERLDLRLCFMADKPIPQMKGKPKYSAWATKEEIQFCIGPPPRSWFKGLILLP